MCLCMPEHQYIIFAASKACNFMLSTWHCNHGYLQLDTEYRNSADGFLLGPLAIKNQKISRIYKQNMVDILVLFTTRYMRS